MTKLKTFSLALLGCAVLTACGSGGGNGDNKSSNNKSTKEIVQDVKNKAKEKTDGVQNNAQKAADKAKDKVQEATDKVKDKAKQAVSITGKAISMKNGTLKDINKASVTSVNVDGKIFPISYGANVYAGTWMSTPNFVACCGKFSDVRLGIAPGNDADNLFVNGNPTKNMPTQGTATYEGSALVIKNNQYFLNDNKQISVFTADFGNKTLTGTLNVKTFQPINVKANISDNNFSGKATSTEFKTQANVTGKFYGDNAKELGGVFRDDTVGADKAWGGVFGASKK